MSHKNKFILRRPFPYVYSRVTLGIIFLNFVVFAVSYLFPNIYQYIHFYGALNASLITEGHMYWQFVTYMFVHQNLSHLFFNMLGLLVFGLQLEKAIGSREFLLFYLVCGALSGAFSFGVYVFTGQMRVFLLGASGAIYAVLFAYAVFFPRSIIMIWGLIPVPAPILVLIYAIIELGSQLMGGGSNVSHITHLFGFLAAWLYFVIRMGIHPVRIWKNTYKK